MPASRKLTPAMEQYQRFKRQYPDAILFFRMGDFYEMFFEDAREGAALLGLTLTRRNHGKSVGDVPLAGIPHHAVEGYLARLVQQGRKVAICEQVEDPRQAKGVVKREVVQVVSPGTALSDAILDRQRNNYLAALCPRGGLTGVALVDLSTGHFSLGETPTPRLADELSSLSPAELLIPQEVPEEWLDSVRASLPAATVSRLDNWAFSHATAHDVLCEQLGVQSLKGFDCEDLELGTCAGGAAIQYLRDSQQGAVAHINHVARRRPEDHLILDATAQRNLELVQNQQDGGRTHTLLEVLDDTRTPMGARLLRSWLVAPLRDRETIEARLDAVEALIQQTAVRASIVERLSTVGDVERLIARICCQRANARDLVALARSLADLPQLRADLSQLPGALPERLGGEELPDVGELVADIRGTLVDDPPLSITEGGLIRSGVDPRIDSLRQVSSGGKEFIARLQTRERERTGIPSLKVGYNQVFGYYIEISKANLEKVPEEYVRKQTLVNAERFITPELKEYESQVLGAEERLDALESELFLDLRRRAASWAAPVQQVARTLAQIDVLATLAGIAQREGYVRPTVDAGTDLAVEGGRHPVVERQLRQGRFVPNDIRVDTDTEQILVVTGPNMAGKSTIIRQLGLIVVMAQMGSFVPARAAHVGLVDRIFTRVGAADDLARGESTFMVEMHEAANILNNVTPRSLVLIDELGRGTSTYDGLSLAWALVEYLHDQPGRQARTLFATHYHEMTQLADQLERVCNRNVLVREEGDHVVFLHRLAPGSCDRSYGIHVARMAGMPGPVIRRATEVLAQLEQERLNDPGLCAPACVCADATHRPGEAPAQGPSMTRSRAGGEVEQMELFPSRPTPSRMESELLEMDVDRLTPLEALNTLHRWRQELHSDHREPR